VRLSIVLTLPPRYRCPLDRLPASRLLPPRSGLERSDFVPWPEGEVLTCVSNVCSPRNCGRDVLALSLTGFVLCAGFRMPAMNDGAESAVAGVRKPPRNEPAG